MIEKIQHFIEDKTSFDVTRNQVIMALAVIIALIVLVVILMMQSGGPKKDPAGFVAPAPSQNLPMHIPGRN